MQKVQDIKCFCEFIQFENICNLAMYFLESTWEESNISQVFKNSGRYQGLIYTDKVDTFEK